MQIIAGVGLGLHFFLHVERRIGNLHFARITVQFKGQRAQAILVRRADVDELDVKRLAHLDVHGDFFARFESIKKCRTWQHGDVAVFAPEFVVFLKHFRIHQKTHQRVIADFAMDFAFQFFARALEVERFQVRTRTTLKGLLFAEHHLLHFARPTADRFAEATFHHINDRLRKGRGAGLEVHHVRRLDAARYQEHRHIAHHFA